MKPLNCRIHRIGRDYFWIAFICSLIVGNFCEFLAITSPTNVKVVNVGYDEAGNVIESISYRNPEWLWLTVICLIALVFICYISLLVIKRYHDVGYSTIYGIISILLVPILIGIFLIIRVGLMPSDGDNQYGIRINNL